LFKFSAEYPPADPVEKVKSRTWTVCVALLALTVMPLESGPVQDGVIGSGSGKRH